MNKENVLEGLKSIIYPKFKRDIVSFGFVKNVEVEGENISIYLEIPSNNSEVKETLESNIKSKFENFKLNLNIKTPQVEEAKKRNIAPNIKHFVMVSSGKGGVGKSSTSVNLALALSQAGKSVGLLDADIYGPNIPRMLSLNNQRPVVDEKLMKLIPLRAYGIKVMSMGMMYEEGQSLIWRGPMIMRAIEQMLTDVVWGELDILVIDMPPGTGDAQLTLAQSVPVSAGISVTTPQIVALDDSMRSIDMFNKLNIPLAGIIENMSGFVCPNCSSVHNIFGKDGGENIAKENNCPILAKIPIEPLLREGGDSGKPIVYFNPDLLSSKEYIKAANKLISFLDEVGDRVDNSSIQPIKDAKNK